MRLRKTLLAALLLIPALAAADGRYQAVAIPGSDFNGKVLILDTQTGYIWTWTEVGASGGGPGGRFLIYQGQVKPGRKPGDIVEQQEWSDGH